MAAQAAATLSTDAPVDLEGIAASCGMTRVVYEAGAQLMSSDPAYKQACEEAFARWSKQSRGH